MGCRCHDARRWVRGAVLLGVCLMALQAKYLTFSKTGAVGQQVVTGVGFQGKALLLWSTVQSVHGLETGAVLCVGMTDGEAQVSRFIRHPGGETATTSAQAERTDRILLITTATSGSQPTVLADASFDGFTADGFELEWLTNDGGTEFIHALVLGGDITVKHVQQKITVNSGQTITVTGLPFQPDCFIVLGGAADEFGTGDYRLGAPFGSIHAFGFSNASENVCAWTLGRGTGGAADCYRGSEESRAFSIRLANNAGATELCGGRITAITDDGFTITRDAGNTVHQPVQNILAIQGARFELGALAAPTTPGELSVPISFEPRALLLQSADASSGVTHNGMALGIGGWDTTDQGGTWIGGVDNSNPSVYRRASYSDSLLRLYAPSTGTLTCDVVATAVGEDAITLEVSTAPTSAIRLLYIVVGDPDPPVECVTPTEGEDFCHVVDVPIIFGCWNPGDGERWFGEEPLEDPADYYGGRKEPDLLQVSEIARRASSSTWDFQIGRFSVVLADKDLAYRSVFTDDELSAFTRREVQLYMISPSGRLAQRDAMTIALGVVDADPAQDEHGGDGLSVTLPCRDRLGAAVSWTIEGQAKLPKRILTPTTLPGLVPSAVGLGVPFPYGRLGVTVVPSGTTAAPRPSGLVAYCARLVDEIYWEGGFAPVPFPDPPTNLQLSVESGGELSLDVPGQRYYVQVFPRAADGTIGNPQPFCPDGKSAAVSEGQQTLTVTWDPSPTAADYIAYLGFRYFGVRWTQYIITSGTSCTFTKSPPWGGGYGTELSADTITPGASPARDGAFHYYRVRGKDGNFRTEWSSPEVICVSRTRFPNGRIRPSRFWWTSVGTPEYEVDRRDAGSTWSKRWVVSASQIQDGLHYFTETFDTPGWIDLTGELEQPSGKVEPIYTGVEIVAGAPRHRWTIAGCAIKGVSTFYYEQAGEEVKINQFGDNEWLVPKLGNWASIIGPSGYVDVTGLDGVVRRYTHLYGIGPEADLAASGQARITLDLEGIENKGDESGEVITNLFDQFVHMQENLLLHSGVEGYTTGLWASRPKIGRQGICAIDYASIEQLKAEREAAFGREIEGAGVVGAMGERRPVTEELATWQRCGDFRIGPNRHWQSRAFALNEQVAASGVTLLDGDLDIHIRTLRPRPALAELFNRFTYRYGRHATSRGTWEGEGLEEINQASIDRWRTTQELELSFDYLYDPQAVAFVLGCIKRRMGDAPYYVEFEGGTCLLKPELDLGQYFRLQHWRGPGPSGYRNRPFWILGSTFLPATRRVRIYAQDVRNLIPALPGDVIGEDDMPRQWTLDLGGSFSQAIVSTDYEPVPEATPYYLQASDFTGFNVDLVLQRSVPLASGSVRLALVDEFGNILAEMTTAATDADPTREVVTTVNLPITPSWCWLAGQVSASGVIGHGKGYLRIRRTT